MEETPKQQWLDRCYEKLAEEIDFVIRTYPMPKVRKDRLGAASRVIRDLKGKFVYHGRNV